MYTVYYNKQFLSTYSRWLIRSNEWVANYYECRYEYDVRHSLQFVNYSLLRMNRYFTTTIYLVVVVIIMLLYKYKIHTK